MSTQHRSDVEKERHSKVGGVPMKAIHDIKHDVQASDRRPGRTSPPNTRQSPVNGAISSRIAQKKVTPRRVKSAGDEQSRRATEKGANQVNPRKSPDMHHVRKPSPDSARRRSPIDPSKRVSPDMRRVSPTSVGGLRGGYNLSGGLPKSAGKTRTIKTNVGGVASGERRHLDMVIIEDEDDQPELIIENGVRQESPSPEHAPVVTVSPFATERMRNVVEHQRASAQHAHQRDGHYEDATYEGAPADEAGVRNFSSSAFYGVGSGRVPARPSPRLTAPAAAAPRIRVPVTTTPSGAILTDPTLLPDSYEALEALKRAIEDKQRALQDDCTASNDDRRHGSQAKEHGVGVYDASQIAALEERSAELRTSLDELEAELEMIKTTNRGIAAADILKRGQINRPSPPRPTTLYSNQEVPTHPEDDGAHSDEEERGSPVRNGTRVFRDDCSSTSTTVSSVRRLPDDVPTQLNSPSHAAYRDIHSPRGSAFSTPSRGSFSNRSSPVFGILSPRT